jgi:hypothetical protein
LIAAAALGIYIGRRDSVARRVAYAVGAVIAVAVIVGLGQAGLSALPGDSWVREEAIFGIAGLVAFVSAIVLTRSRPETEGPLPEMSGSDGSLFDPSDASTNDKGSTRSD